MPKLKTNRGAAKRFKVTGTGKIVRRKAGKRHLLVTKNASRMRSLTGSVQVAKENIANVKRLLPYGGK